MRFLDKHTSRDKQFLRLEREQNLLCRAMRDAPVLPLEKPYQLGWTKTYGLEREVLRRPDADAFARVLAVVNRRVWSRERDFINRDGEAIVLRPRIIPPREWERLGWPASHSRLFSYGHWEDEAEPYSRWRKRRLYIGYSVRRLWWLREDVQPRMITHRRVDLPEVRKRLAEIDTYFTHRLGRERLSRLHGHRWNWREFTTVAERRIAEATHFSIET
ncbi:MAG: hypothetical protein RIQ79_1272 [Verrucomicrobiota bacterium]